jgi:hypothetical protein
MSDTDRESLQRSLVALCDELQVRRLEADDIVELLSDGEDPAWVAEQAIEEEGEGRTQLQQLLSQMAPLVYTAPESQEEEEEDAELEPSDSESSEAAVGAPDDADAPADLQGQLAELRESLPPGVDPAQLEQLLSSERGQLMADFGAFCQERGYDGEPDGSGMDEELQGLHDEWLQTQRPTLEGKRPADMLDGGRLFPEKVVTFRREDPKVGRNDPCPCGSGKKFKKCCGKS